jgi:hypothetical protein
MPVEIWHARYVCFYILERFAIACTGLRARLAAGYVCQMQPIVAVSALQEHYVPDDDHRVRLQVFCRG